MKIGERVRVTQGFHLEGTEKLLPMTVDAGSEGKVYSIEPDRSHPIGVLMEDGRIIQFSADELEVIR